MDEDAFNLSVRKYLKVVGVTSQREIEKAVRDALAAGKISPTDTLDPTVTLDVPAIGLHYVIEGKIDVS